MVPQPRSEHSAGTMRLVLADDKPPSASRHREGYPISNANHEQGHKHRNGVRASAEAFTLSPNLPTSLGTRVG